MTGVITDPAPSAPATPARVRGRSGRWLGTALLCFALAMAAVVAVVGVLVRPSTHLDAAAEPPLRPSEDPRTVVDILEAQGRALIAADRHGWLAAIDPAKSTLVKQFEGYFDALTAMRVSSWQVFVDDAQLTEMTEFARAKRLPAEFYYDVYFGFCWQTSTCPVASPTHLSGLGPPTEGFRASIGWRRVNDSFLMSTFLPTALPDRTENLPWLAAPLKSVVGPHVTVFADRKSTVDLRPVLAEAEKAAAVASRFAHWVKPVRYVVYVADKTHWRSWFRGPQEPAPNAIGYALETSQSSDTVVLYYSQIQRSFLGEVLRHEFGHVVTRLGAPVLDDSFLIEGIAEFIANDGKPVSSYPRRYDVHEYVHSGSWKGDLDSLNIHDGSLLSVSAAYGIGFYTWRCIQNRYGAARMWDFVAETVRYDPDVTKGAADGAPKALGVPWSTVKKQCGGSYLRSI